MWTIFRNWFPLAIAITGFCFLVYGTVQQDFRQSLNDPQIQMAEDAARALENGVVPAGIVPHGSPTIDIAQSLTPWIAVYDEAKTPLESTGVLDGAPPKPPSGVFDAAKDGKGKDVRLSGYNVKGENRVSWQPRPDVRSAIVVVHVNGGKGGYVVAGRNMREIEAREADLGHQVLIAWIVLLAATLGAGLFLRWALPRPRL